MEKTNKPQEDTKRDFVFGKWNYIIMGIGLVILAIGYIPTNSAKHFSTAAECCGHRSL